MGLPAINYSYGGGFDAYTQPENYLINGSITPAALLSDYYKYLANDYMPELSAYVADNAGQMLSYDPNMFLSPQDFGEAGRGTLQNEITKGFYVGDTYYSADDVKNFYNSANQQYLAGGDSEYMSYAVPTDGEKFYERYDTLTPEQRYMEQAMGSENPTPLGYREVGDYRRETDAEMMQRLLGMGSVNTNDSFDYSDKSDFELLTKDLTDKWGKDYVNNPALAEYINNPDWVQRGEDGSLASVRAELLPAMIAESIGQSQRQLTRGNAPQADFTAQIMGAIGTALSFTPLAPIGQMMRLASAVEAKNPLGVVMALSGLTGVGNIATQASDAAQLGAQGLDQAQIAEILNYSNAGSDFVNSALGTYGSLAGDAVSGVSGVLDGVGMSDAGADFLANKVVQGTVGGGIMGVGTGDPLLGAVTGGLTPLVGAGVSNAVSEVLPTGTGSSLGNAAVGGAYGGLTNALTNTILGNDVDIGMSMLSGAIGGVTRNAFGQVWNAAKGLFEDDAATETLAKADPPPSPVITGTGFLNTPAEDYTLDFATGDVGSMLPISGGDFDSSPAMISDINNITTGGKNYDVSWNFIDDVINDSGYVPQRGTLTDAELYNLQFTDPFAYDKYVFGDTEWDTEANAFDNNLDYGSFDGTTVNPILDTNIDFALEDLISGGNTNTTTIDDYLGTDFVGPVKPDTSVTDTNTDFAIADLSSGGNTNTTTIDDYLGTDFAGPVKPDTAWDTEVSAFDTNPNYGDFTGTTTNPIVDANTDFAIADLISGGNTNTTTIDDYLGTDFTPQPIQNDPKAVMDFIFGTYKKSGWGSKGTPIPAKKELVTDANTALAIADLISGGNTNTTTIDDYLGTDFVGPVKPDTSVTDANIDFAIADLISGGNTNTTTIDDYLGTDFSPLPILPNDTPEIPYTAPTEGDTTMFGDTDYSFDGLINNLFPSDTGSEYDFSGWDSNLFPNYDTLFGEDSNFWDIDWSQPIDGIDWNAIFTGSDSPDSLTNIPDFTDTGGGTTTGGTTTGGTTPAGTTNPPGTTGGILGGILGAGTTMKDILPWLLGGTALAGALTDNKPTTTSSVTTNTPAVPDWYDKAQQTMAGNIAAMPLVSPQYTQPLAAGITQNEQAGVDMADSVTGAWAPQFANAVNQATRTAMTIPETDLTQYMNPYMAEVLAPTLRGVNQNFDASMNKLNDAAVSRGAFGGSRNSLLMGLNEENRARALGEETSKGFSNAFNYATDTALKDRAALLNTANSLGSMAGDYQRMLSGDVNQLMSTGAVERGISDNLYTKQYADFLNQLKYPLDAIGAYSGALGSIAPKVYGNTTAQTNTGAAPNMWSNLLGMGATGISLYNQLFPNTTAPTPTPPTATFSNTPGSTNYGPVQPTTVGDVGISYTPPNYSLT